MRTFRLEQSDKEITSHTGISLIGLAIAKFTSLTELVDRALPKRHGTSTSDMIKAYIGLMAQGKNDFEAINNVRNDGFFHQALDLKNNIPTEANIRLRFEKEANELTPLVSQAYVDFIINRDVPITPLNTGHIPMDIDVTPHDNSKIQKMSHTPTKEWMAMHRLPVTLGKKAGVFGMNYVQANNTANVALFQRLSVPLRWFIK